MCTWKMERDIWELGKDAMFYVMFYGVVVNWLIIEVGDGHEDIWMMAIKYCVSD